MAGKEDLNVALKEESVALKEENVALKEESVVLEEESVALKDVVLEKRDSVNVLQTAKRVKSIIVKVVAIAHAIPPQEEDRRADREN